MELDWEKWQPIERRHNQLQADVDFCRERLDLATANARNAEMALLKAVSGQGLFRRADKAAFMRDALENTEDCLARHADHPIASILHQFHHARLDKQKAASAHASAESAFHEHGRSYHKLRHWIAEQHSRGLI